MITSGGNTAASGLTSRGRACTDLPLPAQPAHVRRTGVSRYGYPYPPRRPQPSARRRGTSAAAASACARACPGETITIRSRTLRCANSLGAAQQRVVVAGVADLHRAPDLGRIAADVGAVRVEDAREARDLVRLAAGRIPDVRVLRDHAQRLALAATADPERRIRPLHRLRVRDRVAQRVARALEVRALLA